MQYVYNSGEFIPTEGFTLRASNRGFRFADGFFESVRIVSGKPVFLEHHFSRILDALKAYRINRPLQFSVQKLDSEIRQLIEKNGIQQGGRVRITITRKADGFYLPDSRDMEYFIEATAIEYNRYTLNNDGLRVDVYPEMKKDINKLSMFKNIDAKMYVLASLYAEDHQLDDTLIQNYRGGIIETTTSNIFLVSNGVLYTSTLEDGAIAGIMRMQIINLAIEKGIKVYECTLNPQNLLAADELFVTNAIKGIQWVGSYRTKRYYSEMAGRLIGMLNEKLGC
jgi:branched-subunit amino acid aminotransferase/4-amino-4-deoxychorismate lyase